MVCLFLLLIFTLSPAMLCAQEAWDYDAHGHRDPFVPLVSPSGAVVVFDEDLTAADMVLEGVVVDAAGKSLAIINGKIVGLKERIGAFTVEAINTDQVILSNNQQRTTLQLKKGGM